MKYIFLISLVSLTLALERNLESRPTLIDLDLTSNFEIGAGESIELSIRSNPTTGYTWEVVDTGYENCEVISQRYEPDPEEPGLDGEGGIQYFELYCDEGAEIGTNHVIEMVYKASSEDDETLKTSKAGYIIIYMQLYQNSFQFQLEFLSLLYLILAF